MKQIETANSFVTAVCEVEGGVSGLKDTVALRMDTVQKLLSDLALSLVQTLEKEGNAACPGAVGSKLEEYRHALNEAISSQQQLIEQADLLEGSAGTFVVSVFGKMECGKSYLGNYLLGNAFKGIATNYEQLGPLKLQTLSSPSLDQALAAGEGECAGRETPSAPAAGKIHYFKLGSLIWYDIPGIGSLEPDDEKLVGECVKNSDLVIFCINSDAAGTAQELVQLKALSKQNKPVLILLTRSDTFEYDCGEDGLLTQVLVPKSPQDRCDVEKYIINKLHEQGMAELLEVGGGQVLTISTMLAVEALNSTSPSDEMYEASNMDLFINKLIDMIKSKANQHNGHNLKDRFNELISSLECSLSDLTGRINCTEDVSQARELAESLKCKVLSNIKAGAYNIIHDKVQEASSKMAVDKRSVPGIQIAGEVAEAINAIIKLECNSAFSGLNLNMAPHWADNIKVSPLVRACDLHVPDLALKKIQIHYDIPVRKRLPSGQDGTYGCIQGGCGFYTTTETRIAECEVGDNSFEIECGFNQCFESICRNTLENVLKSLVQISISVPESSLASMCAAFKTHTENAQRRLESLKL